MTSDQKHDNLRKLIDAHNAGYITGDEYLKRSQAVHKAYFDAKYGELDLSDIPA